LADLETLDVQFCSLTFHLAGSLTALTDLDLSVNGLSQLRCARGRDSEPRLPGTLRQSTHESDFAWGSHVNTLDLDGKSSPSRLPPDLAGLETLLLRDNQLSDFILPARLGRLTSSPSEINNPVHLPGGLTNLSSPGS
jgi:hypothetical protein